MKSEKLQLKAFAMFYALCSIATLYGAITGHPWHFYTAAFAALTSALLFNEVRKLNKPIP